MAHAKHSYVGKLEVTVVEAKGLKDANLLSKMSPYVELKCGGETYKTRVAEKGGTAPKFGQSFIFNLDGKDDTVHVSLFAKEMISDDRIGRLDLFLSKVVELAGKEHWFDVASITNFTKTEGSLLLQAHFDDANKKHQVHAQDHKTVAPVAAMAPAPAAAAVVQQPQQQMMMQPQVMMQPQMMQPQMMQQQMVQPQVMFGQAGMPQVIFSQSGQPQVMFTQQPQGMVMQVPVNQFGQPMQQYPPRY